MTKAEVLQIFICTRRGLLSISPKNGTHLGKADPITGNLISRTADPRKAFKIK